MGYFGGFYSLFCTRAFLKVDFENLKTMFFLDKTIAIVHMLGYKPTVEKSPSWWKSCCSWRCVCCIWAPNHSLSLCPDPRRLLVLCLHAFFKHLKLRLLMEKYFCCLMCSALMRTPVVHVNVADLNTVNSDHYQKYWSFFNRKYAMQPENSAEKTKLRVLCSPHNIIYQLKEVKLM